MASKVSAIILNYNGSAEMLEKCLNALAAQTYQPLEIILADNGSTNDAVSMMSEKFPDVKILMIGKNLGFAGGNNRALRDATGDFILFLNNDAYCQEDAVARMVETLESAPDVVGVAPKMMLAQNRNVFDSVGTLIDFYGCAFNMGIGQIDIGQYDRSERVFGGCFGATMIRRRAFDEDGVGLMDESYFLYYEDVDWCLRANILGYRFMTAPKAVVYHEHSASAKKFAYRRKYFLIERNLIRTCLKDFETAKALKLVIRRTAAHIRNTIIGPYRLTSCHLVLNIPFDFVRFFLAKRGPIQRKRKVADKVAVALSNGEKPFFDPANYAPLYDLATLEAMYRRLALVTGLDKHFVAASVIETLKKSKLSSDEQLIKERLSEFLKDEPAVVKEFVSHIQGSYELVD